MNVLVRNQKISPNKVRPVARVIAGKTVEAAFRALAFAPQKAAKMVEKALKSAVANAEHNYNMDVDALKIGEISVDQAFSLKRYTQKAKGRGARILKPHCHIRIKLDTIGA